MPDYKRLQGEINRDPLGIGYTSMADARVADALNTRARPSPVSARDVMVFLLETGVYTDLLVSNTKPARVALFALERLADLEPIDLQSPVVTGLLDGLQAAGLITQPQRDAFVALGNNRRTRAEEIGFPNPSEADIRRVR